MRRFQMVRDEDPTRVSGTGVVAEGIEWTDGRVALCWLRPVNRGSVAFYNDLDHLHEIHGHSGRTRIVWLDSAAAAARSAGPLTATLAERLGVGRG